MTTLTDDDMHKIISFLPKDIVELMKKHDVCLAGGYLRAKIAGEDVNDIDLFCKSHDAAERFANRLAGKRDVVAFRTKNAFTIIAHPRLPVQFIHRWTFSDPVQLVQSFDFTVAKAAIWYEPSQGQWASYADPRFYSDLAGRRLTYTQPVRNEDAGGSILRVQKFLNRGYHISPENFAKVVARLLEGVRPDTPMWDQGGEAGRAQVLTALLREADPLVVVDGLYPSEDSMEQGEALPNLVGGLKVSLVFVDDPEGDE